MEGERVDCMNIEEHFLPEDITKASEEYWSILELMTKIMTLINEGELESAKHHSFDLTLSLHRLTNLSISKYTLHQ